MFNLLFLLSILVAVGSPSTLNFPVHKKVSITDGPLDGGDLIGAYYVQVSIGNPPQTFRLDVDTGSSHMVVVARSCRDTAGGTCQSANPGYNPGASSSSAPVSCASFQGCQCDEDSCGVSVRYGDGSGADGALYQDLVNLEGESAVAYFGAMTRETGSFSDSYSDGILGLAYPVLSDNIPTFMDRLTESGMIPANVFSICINSQDGFLFLGGADSSYYAGDIVYTPIIKQTYYVVDLQQMIVAGQRMDITPQANGDTIIDSGSTGIIVPQSMYNTIIRALQNQCRQSFCDILDAPSGSCGTVTDSDLDSFPQIQFVLRGSDQPTITLTISARTYLRIVNVDGESCADLGIYAQDGEGIILGDAFMKAYYTVFDRQNNKVGFAAPRNCGSGNPEAFASASLVSVSYLHWIALAFIAIAQTLFF